MKTKPSPPVATPGLETRCRNCRHTWPVPVPKIGQPVDAAYFELAMKLCEHLQTKHTDIMADPRVFRFMQSSFRFSHLFFVRNFFQSTDPGLARYQEVSRHAIHHMVRKMELSDETIERKLNSLDSIVRPDLAKDVNDARPFLSCNWVRRDDVIALIKELRDTIEERELYPEERGEAPPMVILAS